MGLRRSYGNGRLYLSCHPSADPANALASHSDVVVIEEEEEIDQVARDAEECNLMDQVPLVDDDEDDDIFEVLQLDCVLSDLGKDDDDSDNDD